jgi:hypothetical protein
MDSPAAPRSALRHAWLPVTLASLGVLWAQVRFGGEFVSDDSYISLRYAERLLAGEGLTWTDGERVEGYSNLLWVLLCAAAGALGADLVEAARTLGTVAAALVVAATAFGCRARTARELPAACAAPLAIATAGPLAVWAGAGLEAPLALLCLCVGLISATELAGGRGGTTARALLRAGLPFALLCLCRPEGPLWLAATAAALAVALRSRERPARLLWFVLPAAIAVTAQLAFRLAYYGEWVPNTAHVKVGLRREVFAPGADYVAGGLWAVRGAVALAAVGVAATLGRPARGRGLVAALPLLAWLGYLVLIGGDHFPGWRHFVPALAPLSLLAATGLRAIAMGRAQTVLAALLCVGMAAANWHATRTDGMVLFARAERWERDGEAIGRWLRRRFGDQREQASTPAPLLAVDAAGALPFYSRLPCLDMLGLCDRTIARSDSPLAWRAIRTLMQREFLPGHMRGNGAYVMDRAPDLLLFGQPPHLPLPVWTSALEFEQDPRYRDGYRCAMAACPRPAGGEPLRVPLWVRLHGRAGIAVTGDAIRVPGYLFGSYRQTRAFEFWAPQVPGTPAAAAWQRDAGLAREWFSKPPALVVDPDAGDAPALRLAGTPAVLDLRGAPLPAGRLRLREVAVEHGRALAVRGEFADGWRELAAAVPFEGREVLALSLQGDDAAPIRVRWVEFERLPR